MTLENCPPSDSYTEYSTLSNFAPIIEKKTISIEHLLFLPGEANFQAAGSHTLFVNQSSRPMRYLQTQPSYSAMKIGLPIYQLNQVLDYIEAELVEKVKLLDLASLLNMSLFN